MTSEQFKNSIRCEIDFTMFIYDSFPKKEVENTEFHTAVNAAIYKAQEALTPQEFKKLGELIGREMHKHYPSVNTFLIPPEGDMETDRNDRYQFRKLFSENEHPAPFYIHSLFTELIEAIITKNLTNTVVELFRVNGSMPIAGQVYCIYSYEIYVKKVFKDYKQLYNIIEQPTWYYLKQINYYEHSEDDLHSEFGSFLLRFCRNYTSDTY